MDLIDRAAYCAEMRSRQEACYKAYEDAKNEAEREHWSGVYTVFVEAKLTLDKLPTIEAVPLDALCEWLAAQDFTVKGEPIVARLDKETWKNVIRECVK